MKIRLEDIIDLEYFISIDDDLESNADIESLAVRDREIFSQCKNDIHGSKDLLLSWLSIRKQQFFKKSDDKTSSALPGAVFSSFYKFMTYLMTGLGVFAGGVTVYSFLAYYGTLSINVMVFVLLFVVLPVILFFTSFALGLKKLISDRISRERNHSPVFIGLITVFLLKGIPKILRKIRINSFARSLDGMEYIVEMYDSRKEAFRSLFFWPFYTLTSLFAFGFSAGTLAGSFFKVLVTDMAFGWQSTLVTSSRTVYDIVAVMALPWSGLMKEGTGWPSLEQIEGSRIVLKDGIQAMATQDLVSWWPFLCMAVLFYALIPRLVLIFMGRWAGYNQVVHFDFEKPRFNQLILRMQSPVMDIDEGKTSVDQKQIKKNTAVPSSRLSYPAEKEEVPGSRASLLLSKTAYNDDAVKKIIQQIKTSLFFDVAGVLPICHDYEEDAERFDDITASGAEQVILVFEVWQPPIRGVLFYIQQLKTFLPDKIALYVMLTQDAEQEDLSVDRSDMNFKIWEKAIAGMGDPDISVTRFM